MCLEKRPVYAHGDEITSILKKISHPVPVRARGVM